MGTNKMIEDWEEVKYFKKEEFVCKCGCGFDKISRDLVMKLEHARIIAGIPFTITSGCRCVKRNNTEGGSPNSAHLRGTAADISCTTGVNRDKIVRAMIAVGFTRIGIAHTFIHVDVDTYLSNNVMWVY
jgi:uncharacterized protein YcbK (DUF882 family)